MDYKSCEVFNIFSLLKKLNGLSKDRVGQFNLNNLETIILFTLNENKSTTQKDLVYKLNAPKQTINSIVMSLKKRNLVTMAEAKTDKRAKIILLTKNGEQEINNIIDHLSRADREIYDDLGEEKIKQIEDDLLDFIDALEKNMKKGEL